MEIPNVAIVGAGTMGQGIATAIAVSDYRVILDDIADHPLGKATLNIATFIDRGASEAR